MFSVSSACDRNEYQEYILGVKAAGAYDRQPDHLHVPTVFKSGSTNHLDTLGPLQVCAGIAKINEICLSKSHHWECLEIPVIPLSVTVTRLTVCQEQGGFIQKSIRIL